MKVSRSLFPALLVGILIGTALTFLFVATLWRKSFDRALREKDSIIDRQEAHLDSIRKNSLMDLMRQVLEKAGEEANTDPHRKVSAYSISQIKFLSDAFKPYPYNRLPGDTAKPKMLSPERGQLLLFLTSLQLDSATFDTIKATVSFAYAMLKDADLRGADLQGADLQGAHLEGADLEGANLVKTNLQSASLWGAKIGHAQLRGMDATRADLKWTDLHDADLREAILHEADLTAARLHQADLRKGILQWTDLTDAILSGAKLDSADMFRATLKRTNLEGALMTHVNLLLANMSEAHLHQTDLTGANLADLYLAIPDWLSRIKDWQVKGADKFQQEYKIIDLSTKQLVLFQLKKKQL